MEPIYTVIFYSRKPLIGRRQYMWRTMHRNGNQIERSSEGYNNRLDRDNAFNNLAYALGVDNKYKVVDEDD